ncbi:helix-turn-helix domain-containing protein [Cryobacterium sp. Y11]|uniref:helix-turn-helix domain-containing protein n=1 Tax=Cryobacterium sp. Y11 TaxID=2045016 RepID=UPI000CE2C64B|nr:helix-turn-helix domain-containing protein [Cryobacterium sp. Y11]
MLAHPVDGKRGLLRQDEHKIVVHRCFAAKKALTFPRLFRARDNPGIRSPSIAQHSQLVSLVFGLLDRARFASTADLGKFLFPDANAPSPAPPPPEPRVGGRPTVITPDTLAAAKARQQRGETPTQIAEALGVSRATIYRHLNP